MAGFSAYTTPSTKIDLTIFLYVDNIKMVKLGKSSRSGLGLGSGIASRVFVGSVVTCPADDNSWYCQLSKLVSTIGMIIFLLVIIFIIFTVLRSFFSKGGGVKSFFLKMAK